MKEEPQYHKVRIKDIAKLANVSVGTVDRVIHNRGEVSEQSREAVNEALKELDYSPNILARSLASKKQYHFVCLIPQYGVDDYFEFIDKGFDEAALEFSNYNVIIEKMYFDQFDVNSFLKTSQKVLVANPDAVFLAPTFRDEAICFVEKLDQRNIPFSYVDSCIDNTNFCTYYGQNSFQSGYVAAKLLLQDLPVNSQIAVIRSKRKKGVVSNQTSIRHNGFIHYIQKHSLENNFKLVDIEFTDNEADNINVIKKLYEVNNRISAAITFNSRAYLFASYLEKLHLNKVRMIGYDLLERNVNYLQQDVLTHIIAQRPERQSYMTARDMCRKLIFDQEVKRINYVPIDILVKENIDYYLSFQE